MGSTELLWQMQALSPAVPVSAVLAAAVAWLVVWLGGRSPSSGDGSGSMSVLGAVPGPFPWHVCVAAVLGGWAGAVFGSEPLVLLAFVPLMGAWAVAAVVDVAEERLPNVLTWGGWLGFSLLSLPATLVLGAPGWRALGAGVVTAVTFFVLAWFAPASYGLGDVKLGLSTGAVLGWFGWSAVAWGAVGAFMGLAVFGLGLVIWRRSWSGLRAQVPFGPFLMAGALTGPWLL